jgi:ligand-binding sensor domain-containing protein
LSGVFTIITRLDGTHLFGGSAGVTQFDGEEWQPLLGLDNTYDILDIQELPNGNLWFAVFIDGVYSYDGSSWRHYTEADGLVSNHVNSIALTPDGMLWVSSCYGISQFDGQSWKTYMKVDVREDGLPIFCNSRKMVVDQSGVVWVATERGLLRIEEDRQTIYTTLDGLAENDITDITVGPDGTLWIGTHAGLSRFVPPGK